MFRFTLLAILLAALLFAVVEVGVVRNWFHRPSYSREIVLFLMAMHIGLYSLLSRQISQHPIQFAKIYLGTTVLRILFFGAFTFIVLWIDPASGTNNALLFLLSYFLFTSLEVVTLFIDVNRQKPTNLGQKEG